MKLISLIISAFLILGLSSGNNAMGESLYSITTNKIVEIVKSEGLATFDGGVKIEQKESGSYMKADKMTLKRHQDSGELLSAIANGSVIVEIKEIKKQGSKPFSTVVTCEQAKIDKVLDFAELIGSVKVDSIDYQLTAEQIRYNLDTQIGRLTENPGKQVEIVFFKNRDRDNSEKTDGVKAQAMEIQINRNLRRITLQGNVTVVDQFESTSFNSQRADIYFDKTDDLQRIVANNNVKIQQPQRSSGADIAFFDYVNETITLSGNASVVDSSKMEIKSPIIKMHMNADKGFVSGDDENPIKMNVPLSQ